MTATLRPARPDDLPALFAVWRNAVLATHQFLSADDFAFYESLVRDVYLPQAHLTVAVDAADVPLGFIGCTGSQIDALFVDPVAHGQGIGSRLLRSVRQTGGGLLVDVNEQNLGARAFYERMGYSVVSRREHDDAGRPYPVLGLVASDQPWIVVVALACVRNGRLLVVRKRGTSRFMLPGGKPEPGETSLVALAREIEEELGCGVTGLDPLGRFAAPAANEAAHRVLADIFTGELVGEIAAAAEIEAVDWLDLQAPELPLAPLLEDAVLPVLAAS
ncbi:acetyltransferase [Chitinolyticbacter meiyuanensis]|uniref:acetyltransferase n=1 Tax=Chitinolyticbacter meiyuanensis TaxID=682798 RepID=UPI001FE3D12F|nr:acetyltransferase [Chitinolyticbacter meiyuanensis]